MFIKIINIYAVNIYDYPTYIQNNGISYANERRKLYKIRHKKDINVKFTSGYYSDKILW